MTTLSPAMPAIIVSQQPSLLSSEMVSCLCAGWLAGSCHVVTALHCAKTKTPCDHHATTTRRVPCQAVRVVSDATRVFYTTGTASLQNELVYLVWFGTSSPWWSGRTFIVVVVQMQVDIGGLQWMRQQQVHVVTQYSKCRGAGVRSLDELAQRMLC